MSNQLSFDDNAFSKCNNENVVVGAWKKTKEYIEEHTKEYIEENANEGDV